jgi:hypothetical protein
MDRPSTIDKARKSPPGGAERDVHDPTAMPSAPRGPAQPEGIREAETGAPKGRGPDGKIISR